MFSVTNTKLVRKNQVALVNMAIIQASALWPALKERKEADRFWQPGSSPVSWVPSGQSWHAEPPMKRVLCEEVCPLAPFNLQAAFPEPSTFFCWALSCLFWLTASSFRSYLQLSAFLFKKEGIPSLERDCINLIGTSSRVSHLLISA